MADRAGPSRHIRPDDPGFDDKIQQWLDSDLSDVESDVDSDFVIQSDHNTDTEEEGTGSEGENQESTEEQYFYGKNRYKWAANEPARNVRTPGHNIIRLPMLRSEARLENKIECKTAWNFIFSKEMLQLIVRWTNVKMFRMRLAYKRMDRPEIQDTDDVEMEAFLGLLLYTAAFKSNNEDISAMFATDGTGREIFRLIMSGKRFLTLLLALRFDNPEDRVQRRMQDPTAAVSELLRLLIENSQKSYSLGANACIDEMLIAFRGRCAMKVYMPKKPDKYGLKLMCMTDARTDYFYNGYLYAGRDTDGIGLSDAERKLSKPTQSVLRLSKPIQGTNRNITFDNWFTSIELAEKLNSVKLTCLGTVKKNKREIPNAFLPSKQREVGSSLYGFTSKLTLLSHVPKKNRAVIMLSSVHHNKGMSTESGKPEMIDMYNTTKGGVDSLDKKCASYSSSRRTRRWPMAVFFRVVDISAANAYVLFQSCSESSEISKLNFLKTLAAQMVKQHMERRLSNQRMPRDIRTGISRILKIPVEEEQEEKLEKKKACRICPSSKKRRTAYSCIKCKNPICLQCSRKICINCVKDE